MKYSVITSFLGSSKDRFHDYNEPKTLAEKFEMASRIKGMSAVEVVYPYEANNVEETLALMKKYNLGISAVNVNIKAEPEFKMGGITSSNKKIREKAISFMKEGKAFAKALGVNKIQVCPLGDGYEFAFEADYEQNWIWLKEAFSEVADYLPEILCIDNPANTILLVSFLLNQKSLVCQCLLNLVQYFFQLREFPAIYPFSNLTFLSLP